MEAVKLIKSRRDIVVLLSIVLIGLMIALTVMAVQTKGTYVYVKADGETVFKLPLDKDTELEISSNNGGKNTLMIKDGQACIVSANCPDKLCVKKGGISKNGQCIVCLPNKVVVEIHGEKNSDARIDVITGGAN